MAYFACALFNLILAGVWTLSGQSYPMQPLSAPGTLIAVHLTTVGWLTLLMLGALAQFVPVITAKPLPSQRLALIALILIEAGLAFMIMGFLALYGMLPLPLRVLLPAGGSLVAVGLVTITLDILLPLLQSGPKSLPARMVVAALGFLLAAAVLGLLFALGLGVTAAATRLSGLLAFGLRLHLIAGLGGWFLLTAVGVSYKLLSMFMLAPEERGMLGEAIFVLLGFGVLLAWGSGILDWWFHWPAWRAAFWLGFAAVVAGVVLYLVDMARLYSERKRRKLELNNIAALAALAMLGLSTLLGVWAALEHGRWWGEAVFLFLAGYLSGLGLSQLYKIVPFLTWVELFGPRLGKAPVPKVQDLVVEKRAAPWFAAYFASVPLTAGAEGFGARGAARLMIGIAVISLLAIVLELWRARRPATTAISPFANGQ